MRHINNPAHNHKFFAALTCPAQVTWTNDIKKLFTALDVDHMKQVANFDLSSYQDVKIWATAIYSAVSSGHMPPPNSGEKPWTPDMVNTFGCWIQQGCPQ
jgi:hypothetical protein